jgi:hypothetical protein
MAAEWLDDIWFVMHQDRDDPAGRRVAAVLDRE